MQMPRLLLVSALIAPVALAAVQADDTRTERVQFAHGANSATVEASITGYETVDYVLGAAKGQAMNVSMATDNKSNYFNILPPGSDAEAMFIGSTKGNQFEGTLPESGDYKVRVYLMRNAARRNETANYRLEMIIAAAGKGTAAPGSDGKSSAERAGEGDFDATGKVPCAQGKGAPMGQCDFGVAREGGGTATVVVTRPDGGKRALFFVDGKFNSADTSQADGDPEVSADRVSDLNMIRVGDERYEIPDAVISGG